MLHLVGNISKGLCSIFIDLPSRYGVSPPETAVSEPRLTSQPADGRKPFVITTCNVSSFYFSVYLAAIFNFSVYMESNGTVGVKVEIVGLCAGAAVTCFWATEFDIARNVFQYSWAASRGRFMGKKCLLLRRQLVKSTAEGGFFGGVGHERLFLAYEYRHEQLLFENAYLCFGENWTAYVNH